MALPPLTLGIEEEYQIIDPETRELRSCIQEFLEQGRVVLRDQIKAEFMQSQVEVGSHICHTVKEVRREIIRLRRAISDEVPFRSLVIELLELVDDVLDELDVRDEVEYVHTILADGTSADRQLTTFHRTADLKAVVDQLVKETREGW